MGHFLSFMFWFNKGQYGAVFASALCARSKACSDAGQDLRFGAALLGLKLHKSATAQRQHSGVLALQI
jgi:hypothetical protein